MIKKFFKKDINSLNPDEMLCRLLLSVNFQILINEFDIIKNKLLDEIKYEKNKMIDYELIENLESNNRKLFNKTLSILFYYDKLSSSIVKYPLTLGVFRNLSSSGVIKSSYMDYMS